MTRSCPQDTKANINVRWFNVVLEPSAAAFVNLLGFGFTFLKGSWVNWDLEVLVNVEKAFFGSSSFESLFSCGQCCGTAGSTSEGKVGDAAVSFLRSVCFVRSHCSAWKQRRGTSSRSPRVSGGLHRLPAAPYVPKQLPEPSRAVGRSLPPSQRWGRRLAVTASCFISVKFPELVGI